MLKSESTRPRILHIGDVAGVPQALANAETELGCESRVLSFEDHPFEYGVDFSHPVMSKYPVNAIRKFAVFLKYFGDYDVFHFHGSTVLPRMMDLAIWKSIGRGIILHFHGSDIRGVGVRDGFIRYADDIIVATPDLLKWCPSGTYIPNPIDLSQYPFIGVDHKPKSEAVNIVHAPSSRLKKGTHHFVEAVERLKSEGYNVRLIIVEDLPHKQALEIYKEADIITDQLLVGWYGMFAIECMALGKPVCTYVSDDLQEFIDAKAIVNINPLTLYDHLKMLVENYELRRETGRNGRLHVENVHESSMVARQGMSKYL